MRERFDVCVVGAGPAGSVAACRLAGKGVRTLLVDRHGFPRDKVCGDGVGPRAFGVLARLGAFPRADFPGVLRLEGVRISSPGRHSVEVCLKDDPEVGTGYVVPRSELDAWLVRVAEESGAILRTGFEIRALESSRGGMTLRGVTAGRPEAVRASFVVGAWGAQAGAPARRYPACPGRERYTVVAVRAYFSGLGDIGPYMEIHFDPDLVPGYGWVFPTAPGTANIGYGMRLDCLRRSRVPLRSLFRRFVDTNPYLRRYMQGARQASPLRGARIPLRRPWQRVSHGRLLLVGDAAGFADPLSGEGIGTAMESGWIAAESLRGILERGGTPRSASRAYAAACRKEITRNLFYAQMLQSILVRPPLVSTERVLDAFVEKAGTHPRMARAMARLVIGDLPRDVLRRGEVWKKLLRVWARAPDDSGP